MSTKSTDTAAYQSSDLPTFCLAFTEHAPLAMTMVEGTKHVVCYANPAFCHLVDKPMEDLIGKPWTEKMAEKGEYLTHLNRVYETGNPESYVAQKSLAPNAALFSYAMWPVTAGKHTVGVMIQVIENTQLQKKTMELTEALLLGSLRQHELIEEADFANAHLKLEISERKEAEKSLHVAQAQLTDRAGQLEGLVVERTGELTATNHQLEAFAHSVAHDLRSPLQAILGYATLLSDEGGSTLNENCKHYALRIGQSAQFMDALLSDLLAFSRISQQRVILAPIELKTVVESVVSRLEMEVQQKKARVESVGPWPVVRAHAPALAQVLTNLMTNALKFVAPGVAPVVRLWTEDRDAFVRVWVEDNGLGIAPAYKEQIFRLFSRLHGVEYPGTGVGLAIVQKGIERMGGKTGVESTLGEGSRFWFELQKA